ncbi:glycoside hydrolase family 76 protein [Microlunatus speluncae]|uniref:glycoside hydrolase family 76 protein n=1 Tax=Microlunatus speluncae TaxID=2594267 RepID=UPI0012662330|nr:glycoside hydrolase family 76 protein [Microlunatus speluncae]
MTRRAIGAAIAALVTIGMITLPTTAAVAAPPDAPAARDTGDSRTAAARLAAEQQASEDRLADGATIYGRSIELHISDADALGWARISNGDPTDEVWLDRSFDGGETVADERLGYSTIPAGTRSVTTPEFSLNDGDREGVFRACGKAGNVADIACTGWVGVEEPQTAGTPAKRAIDALMRLYNEDTGLWKTTGWWNSANVLTAVLDYQIATGDDRYEWVIANTYDKNKDAQGGNFTNDYIDDTGWWALAWIRAYDITGEQRYLDTAIFDAEYMWDTWSDVCGGGVIWNINVKYKNAVTNELMIKVLASLANRVDDASFLDRAVQNWEWLRDSGMINSRNMINDGLNDACENNGQPTWTYNQGIVLGALAELEAATGDKQYLRTARKLALASTRDRGINPKGILTEPCEAGDCGADGPTFKGVYVRNLAELNAALPGRPFQVYLERQAKTSYAKDRNRFDQYGLHWAGPLRFISAATQQSATEAQVAPLR